MVSFLLFVGNGLLVRGGKRLWSHSMGVGERGGGWVKVTFVVGGGEGEKKSLSRHEKSQTCKKFGVKERGGGGREKRGCWRDELEPIARGRGNCKLSVQMKRPYSHILSERGKRGNGGKGRKRGEYPSQKDV